MKETNLARCYICDTFIDKPKIDRKTGKIAHCGDCDDVIGEILSDFDDDPDEVEIEVDIDA